MKNHNWLVGIVEKLFNLLYFNRNGTIPLWFTRHKISGPTNYIFEGQKRKKCDEGGKTRRVLLMYRRYDEGKWARVAFSVESGKLRLRNISFLKF